MYEDVQTMTDVINGVYQEVFTPWGSSLADDDPWGYNWTLCDVQNSIQETTRVLGFDCEQQYFESCEYIAE